MVMYRRKVYHVHHNPPPLRFNQILSAFPIITQLVPRPDAGRGQGNGNASIFDWYVPNPSWPTVPVLKIETTLPNAASIWRMMPEESLTNK
jgi:hypothetical protein